MLKKKYSNVVAENCFKGGGKLKLWGGRSMTESGFGHWVGSRPVEIGHRGEEAASDRCLSHSGDFLRQVKSMYIVYTYFKMQRQRQCKTNDFDSEEAASNRCSSHIDGGILRQVK